MANIDDTSLFDQAYKAIEENNVVQLQHLIDQGMDINITDDENQNLLWHACDLGRPEPAKWLIKHQIKLNAVSSEHGESALMISAMSEMHAVELVRLLLDAGANANSKNRHGMVAAVSSILSGEQDAFLLLMDAGTNINSLFPYQDKRFYINYANKPFFFDYVNKHIDQLTPENLTLWKTIRLNSIFKKQ